MSDKKNIEHTIEHLLKLKYITAYTGQIGKPEPKSYVLYADVVKMINKLRRELQKE